MIIAIDPGNIESAYCIMEHDLKPVEFGKVKNEELLTMLEMATYDYKTVIEMIASYGMPVGKEVFDTCVWIGRFDHASFHPASFVYRKDVKMHLCGTMKAKDSNIRQALIDRFARHDFKNGKGTKKKPDWFHGFSNDVWQAYAVGITYFDLYLKNP